MTDQYLDALLAGAVLGASSPGEPDAAGRLDPTTRTAAERLRRDLVRVHPSFRFEERLATRLAESAIAMRIPIAAGAEGRIVAFRPAPLDAELIGPGAGPFDERHGSDDDTLAAAFPDGRDARLAAEAGRDPARRAPARPLLIGGALTSAALSIAGAAFVAWRRGRPSRSSSPMVRAARAVREVRLADPLDAHGARHAAAFRRVD